MKKLLLSVGFLFFGGILFLAAAARVLHPAYFGKNAQNIGFAGLLIAFIFGLSGFLFFISWLDALRARRRPPVRRSPEPRVRPGTETPPTGVYALREGVVYRVQKSFEDCYKNQFAVDETLTFQQRNFIPYHGGHTLVFAERSIYLQEEISAEILAHFESYLAPVNG